MKRIIALSIALSLLIFSAISVAFPNKTFESCGPNGCQCWFIYCASGYKFEFCGTEDALNKTIEKRCGVGSSVKTDIVMVTFEHYETNQKPTWDETEDDYKLIMGGAKLFNTATYQINPTGSGLTEDEVKNAFNLSSEEWDSKTSFELFNPPQISYEGMVGYDGKNTIVWSSLKPGIIAKTYLWINKTSKEIVEFDMEFNTYYTWGDVMINPSVMDLQDIATHEFGHSIGLDDLYASKDWALTMYGYSSVGETIKRDLGYGDILGVQKLYGV